jgi:hypothetical protein
MSDDMSPTTFKEMYDYFLAGITDDMFMELTPSETDEMSEEILVAAMPYFEFPKWKDPFKLDMEHKCFNTRLTNEEMRILRSYMIVEWLGYQIANVDLVRQKYSGSDFSFTSQAAHLKQLMELQKSYREQGLHLQRLYNRRELDKNGHVVSSFYRIMQPINR